MEFYTYLYGNSPGVGCSVLGVQFYKHGERLRGVGAAGGVVTAGHSAFNLLEGTGGAGRGGIQAREE